VLRASLAALLLTLAASIPAAATVVANYSFAGNSLASSDTDPSSTASDIAVGAGLSGKTQFFTVFGTTCFGTTSDNTPSTEAAALSANDYLEFTITPSSGVSLSFSSLDFNLAFNGFAFPYTANAALRWSVDAFGSTVGTATLVAAGNSVLQGESITLNSGLVQSAPVDFRLYFYDTQDTSFDTIGIRQVMLNAIAVPEPSSKMLLLLAGSVLIVRRKR
jgi:hypothetical protein